MALTENFNGLANPAVSAPLTMREQIDQDKLQQQKAQPRASRSTSETIADLSRDFLLSFTPAMNRGMEQLSQWFGGQDTWWGRVFDSMKIRKGGSMFHEWDEVDRTIQRAANGEGDIDTIDFGDAGVPVYRANQDRVQKLQQESLEASWGVAKQAGGFTDQGVAGYAPTTLETPPAAATVIVKPPTPTGMA